MEPEPSPSILLNCVLEGDEEELPKLLGDVGNPRHKKMLQHLMEQDVAGRSIVHIACMMGRSNIIQEFAKNGVSLNEKTARGYLPIHFAAAWGHLETLHTLVELGADLEGLNFLDERAREIAFRYSKMDCVDFLDWAEAKQALQTYIASIQAMLTDQEKVQGRLLKDEKLRCISACKNKSEWLANTKNPTRQELLDQKQQLEDTVLPFLHKLTAPSPEKVKSGKF
ncbi:ankyrin repeat domain-containing protein 45 isoform X3 [Rhinatrema bivittatum]|uniref:ankyrin repeat domain-containing protein 45 isoform X3 n=1 Tax=Rhinatrema bivittatum TaxID=194408 RepID=UPI001127ACD7|nr:ankyrin repeat domain-containing protein 45 isoform X3 [Rhinatrema bivittatum]